MILSNGFSCIQNHTDPKIKMPVSSAIIFANSLDPDQARQNVGPDLDPNRLTL